MTEKFNLFSEKNGLKATFKSCLLQDMPEFFPVFTRVGWLPLEEFLTVEMLAQLYSEVHVLLNNRKILQN